MPNPTLPDVMPGHWETPAGAAMAREYAGKKREDLIMGDRADLDLANAVYLVDRSSVEFLPLQQAAKERIRWLSVQLAMAKGGQP